MSEATADTSAAQVQDMETPIIDLLMDLAFGTEAKPASDAVKNGAQT